jgi:hypothetical protein
LRDRIRALQQRELGGLLAVANLPESAHVPMVPLPDALPDVPANESADVAVDATVVPHIPPPAAEAPAAPTPAGRQRRPATAKSKRA